MSTGKTNGGCSLPAFRIPDRVEGLYSDVFGLSEEGRWSRENSKSKWNSSSVLSSKELNPLRRPVTGDDVALSSSASKLRYRLLTIFFMVYRFENNIIPFLTLFTLHTPVISG